MFKMWKYMGTNEMDRIRFVSRKVSQMRVENAGKILKSISVMIDPQDNPGCLSTDESAP
jgi:hypothetical protein